MSTPVMRRIVYVDGHLLAASPAGSPQFDTSWPAAGVKIAKHTTSVRGYTAKNYKVASQSEVVQVATVATPMPTVAPIPPLELISF